MFKLVSVILIFLSCHLYAQQEGVKFERLNTNHGLSQSFVISITQDKKGFMWFGTDAGLNKYDGYKFTIYRNNPDDSATLRSNGIWSLFVDSQGRMWVGTLSGLDRFDEKQNTFIHFKGNYVIRDIIEDKKGNIWVCSDEGLSLVDEVRKSLTTFQNPKLETQWFKTIWEDSKGNFWVGSRAESEGVFLFDPKQKTFTSVEFQKDRNNQSYHERLSDIMEDQFGVLWVSTNEGIHYYDTIVKSFIRLRQEEKNENSISSNNVHCLAEDAEGNLWVGHSRGVSILDKARQHFSHHKYDIDNPDGLSESFITTIYKDKSNNLWLGSRNTGLNVYHFAKNNFKLYAHELNNPRSLSNNVIKAITKDKKGRLWLGTDGGGLALLKEDGTFLAYKHDPKNPNTLPNNLILALYEDKQENLWVSTFYGALSKLNKEKGTFEHIFPGPDSTELTSASVSVMCEDSKGNFWVGTWYDGLFLFDRLSKRFKNFKHQNNDIGSLSSGEVVAIYEDKRGNLWVGTTNGLDLFNYATKKFIHYTHDENNKNSVSNNSINSLSEDNNGNLLIGTNNGLSIFNHQKSTFTHYSSKNGLPSNVIDGALCDDEGNIWLSTLNGICKFNPQTKAYRNYSVADGLQGSEFIRHSYFRSEDGEIFFGGNFGANCITPRLIKPNLFVPPIVLTDFKIFNESAEIGDKAPKLQQHINYTQTIRLSYRESVFPFEFASLNFTNPEGNQYAYHLEGFDKNWNYVGNKNSATYTNLNAGEYVFKVIGTNNDGVWNTQGSSVRVIITPPFWLTPWFKIVSIFLVAMSLVTVVRARLNVINKQKAELQRQVQERTKQLVASTEEAQLARQEAEQANRTKSIFLATMSHEIRTPMNGVLGMASLLAETSLTSEQREYTHTIQSSGEALLGVINDILDFSKIESGKMELESNDFNLRDCIEEVLDVFAVTAAKSQLDLIYEIDYNVPAQIIGDSLRLRQVLLNLVSNAIKFTHEGEIFIGVRLQEMHGNDLQLKFEVRDTGIGIPKDKLERLFKAFSQVDSSTTRKYGGTGLGLVISEKLVALMGGEIKVESEPGLGTQFMFTVQVRCSNQATKTYVHMNTVGLEGKRILVTDDNETNLTILKNQLVQWNLVPVIARSGKEALAILNDKQNFDLVLTDMQMPEMDGMELARQIRKQHNALPIILLSSLGERSKEHNEVFVSVLTKPVKQAILYKHIVAQLTKNQKSLLEDIDVRKNLSVDFAKQFPLNILIAEDNLTNQKLADRVLSKLGYVTDKVLNGREAVDAQHLHHYDIILMDIQMPEMDGLDATRAIRQQMGPRPVIIAMTANAMQGDREMCIQAGMDDYISKPIKLEELLKLLEKWATKKTAPKKIA
ncbi:hybrid sensor histidine kinase/response regulator [Chryseolinea sp. H1M3-3]|uniref:hybrid sensor histidine kinase/response regulator n=1 Tax=Chryseolinea sp. H1M3-3 TaxID=3034144 RepID=UPI0023EDFB7C|nr:hybrid sensor histidine kinase/response regulator [Chryseolinea sp. H1M3-3]